MSGGLINDFIEPIQRSLIDVATTRVKELLSTLAISATLLQQSEVR